VSPDRHINHTKSTSAALCSDASPKEIYIWVKKSAIEDVKKRFGDFLSQEIDTDVDR